VTGVKRQLLAAALVLSAVAAARPARAQEAVFLVRHAERADSSKDSPLSTTGTARAERLAAILADAGITAIYTTEYQRTKETAAPLGRAVHVAPVVVSAADSDALLRKVRASGPHDRVLVVGHSNTVPDLIRALGVATPVVIGEEDYDNLFIVIPQPGGAPRLVRLRF